MKREDQTVKTNSGTPECKTINDMKMEVLQFEEIIPEYLMCYLINSDICDLSSTDLEEVQKFESSFTKEYKVSSLIYSLKDSNEDPFFSSINSINKMGCNCYTVIVTLFLHN